MKMKIWIVDGTRGEDRVVKAFWRKFEADIEAQDLQLSEIIECDLRTLYWTMYNMPDDQGGHIVESLYPDGEDIEDNEVEHAASKYRDAIADCEVFDFFISDWQDCKEGNNGTDGKT
jgi:hypothetical protein